MTETVSFENSMVFQTGKNVEILNEILSMLSYLANFHMKKNVDLIHCIYEFPCIQYAFRMG